MMTDKVKTHQLCTHAINIMTLCVHSPAPDYLADMVVPVAHLHGQSHLHSAEQGHFDIPFTDHFRF